MRSRLKMALVAAAILLAPGAHGQEVDCTCPEGEAKINNNLCFQKTESFKMGSQQGLVRPKAQDRGARGFGKLEKRKGHLT